MRYLSHGLTIIITPRVRYGTGVVNVMVDDEVAGLDTFSTLIGSGDKDLIYRTSVALGEYN